jgi:hypothetical protein
MAEDPTYNNQRYTAVKVPRPNDLVKQGILSDIVEASGHRIEEKGMAKEYFETIAARSNVPAEEYKKFLIHKFNYNLYSIGYVLPHIEDGTQAADSMNKIVLPVDNVREEVKAEFGVEL